MILKLLVCSVRFRCYDSFDFLFIFLSGFFKRGRDVFSLDLFSVAELGSIDFVFFCGQGRIFFDCFFEISFLLGCSFPLNCKYLHLSAYFFYEFAVSLCVFRYQSSC